MLEGRARKAMELLAELLQQVWGQVPLRTVQPAVQVIRSPVTVSVTLLVLPVTCDRVCSHWFVRSPVTVSVALLVVRSPVTVSVAALVPPVTCDRVCSPSWPGAVMVA